MSGGRGVGETTALQLLKTGLWVGTKQKDENWMFEKAADLYLSKEFEPDFCIETLLGEKVSRASLVSAEDRKSVV